MFGFDGILIMIGTLATVLGVFVTVWIMRRSELRKRIDDLIDELKSATNTSELYWSIKHDDDEALLLEIKIKNYLATISTNIERLNRHYFSYRSKTMVAFIGYKQSLTDGEFETRPHNRKPARLERISSKHQVLEAAIRDGQKFF